ncbi:hypothetical protein DSAG12_00564 [Promethearchaeum syntrophicum]|uniref:Uncharacterized protein n=1 Tax=Promethearchaeum syntrophicum TaxID=2594042 RepID=A0A5B9D6K1_9ARCH|nr:hypothetical protein [Candidatus Prometheoarchaeum syntrophicum]QEE14749.1 hypothetical protein DSAG12_00564 [Candidatus Prometheoarchaeum syntrophicum]
MMDKTSAVRVLLSELCLNLIIMNENEQREYLLNRLKQIEIYEIVLKEVIVYRLKDLEPTTFC